MKSINSKQCLIALIFIFFSFINLHADHLKKISLQLMWLDQFEFAGFYIAKEKGFYKEVGLDVTLKKFTSTTNVLETVLNGKADFGTSSTSLLVANSLGKDVLLLGSVFQTSPLILLALKESGIKTLSDIKGKKAMITQEQTTFATLQTMLKSENLKISDLEILKHSFDIEDLIDGTTDLMLAYTTNEPFILQEKGYESQIFNPKDYGFDFYEELIFTTNKYNKKNPKVVTDFYTASIKGWQYAFDNIEETAQLIFKKYNPQNKSLKSLIYEGQQMKKLSMVDNIELGTISKDKLKLIENSYKIMGLLKNDLNFETLLLQNRHESKLKLTPHEQEYLIQKKDIKMCVDPNWMPYEKIQNGKHIGMSADFIKLIEKSINTPITLVPTIKWSQSIGYAKNRTCDIFSLAKQTPLRRKYMDFTTPYFNFPVVIATSAEELYITKVESVLNKPIGIVKDFALIELLKLRYPHINIVEVNSPKDGLEKVKSGEIFGYIDSLITIGYELQRNFTHELKVSGQLDINFSLSIASRNDEPLLHSILQKATKRIEEKTKQNIINNWISIEVQKGIDTILLWQIFGVVGVIILAFIYREVVLNKANSQLEKKVDEKTVELKELNDKLEKTVRTRTEELQDSVNEFQHMLQTTMEAIFILQYDYCVDANDEALKLFKYMNVEKLIGTYLYDLVDKSSHECVKENEAQGKEKSYEIKSIKKDGTIFPAMIKVHSFKTKNRVIKVVTLMDLTKLKEQELELIKQSKMASLAELIGNIAHQWRQPLAVISTAASGMKMQKELDILSDEEFDETCESIVETSKYLSQTINDFKHLIKTNKHEKEFDINKTVQKSISLLSSHCETNSIKVITSFTEEINVIGHENELTQAILNIIKNSNTALIQNNKEDERFIFISITKNDKISITVRDNAGGIAEDIIDKIFEPYFTTQHQARGTGLGLYTTHQIIVDNMKGHIDVQNIEFEYLHKQYKGAQFHITL